MELCRFSGLLFHPPRPPSFSQFVSTASLCVNNRLLSLSWRSFRSGLWNHTIHIHSVPVRRVPGSQREVEQLASFVRNKSCRFFFSIWQVRKHPAKVIAVGLNGHERGRVTLLVHAFKGNLLLSEVGLGPNPARFIHFLPLAHGTE